MLNLKKETKKEEKQEYRSLNGCSSCVMLSSHAVHNLKLTPTMMMTNLSVAVQPMTSNGAAFSPSGITCGVGLLNEGSKLVRNVMLSFILLVGASS